MAVVFRAVCVYVLWVDRCRCPTASFTPTQNNQQTTGTFRNYKYAAGAVYHSGIRPDVVYQYEDAPGMRSVRYDRMCGWSLGWG